MILIINKSSINWILKNKNITDIFNLGDFVFVKKDKNIWNIKQYPKVNGGHCCFKPVYRRS